MGRIGNAQMIGNREGFDLRVEMHRDRFGYEPYPGDYPQSEIDAWVHQDWEYVSLHVVASRSVTPLGDAWAHGIERGDFPAPDISPVAVRFYNPLDSGNVGYAGTEIEALIGLALANAKAELAQLQKA